MKRRCIYLALVLALTLVPAGLAQARMWVGGQGGINWLASTDIDATVGGVGGVTAHNVKFDNPNALGGVIVGYDFVKEGFLGYNYPAWMKYFSFAIDFTYNNFGIRPQDVTVSGAVSGKFNTDGYVHGAMPTLSFLFMGKYGFFPDSEVPFGRLQPYVAVGPGIVFSSIRTGIGNASSTDVCLVAEGGVRYMALKNVSLDVSFRYRFFRPSYTLKAPFFDMEDDNGVPAAQGTIKGKVPVDVELDAHSFTALFRVSYHF